LGHPHFPRVFSRPGLVLVTHVEPVSSMSALDYWIMVVPRGKLDRGYIVHLTSVENLPSIWGSGVMLAPSQIPDSVEVDELGSRRIKDRRAARKVPCSAGGVVADYVPFYFSARSPMLYFAYTGNPLSPFTSGQADLVHLVSHVDVVVDYGCVFAIADRNATLVLAEFSDDRDDLDDLVDWTLQNQRFWNNTPDQPDRMERRMAEFLVHDRLPVDAIVGVVVMDDSTESRVLDTLAGYDDVAVHVKRDWYY